MLHEKGFELENDIQRFMGVKTKAYWLYNSSIEVGINLPEKIHNIFVGDITKCYESVPLDGIFGLKNIITWCIAEAFKRAEKQRLTLYAHFGFENDIKKVEWKRIGYPYKTWKRIGESKLKIRIYGYSPILLSDLVTRFGNKKLWDFHAHQLGLNINL